VVSVLFRAACAMVGVRDGDMAVLAVANGVWVWTGSGGVGLEAPLAAVEAVAVSVVTGLHAEETVVVGLDITVFILEDVGFMVWRRIGPVARSLCSVEWGNRER
jgi:hypothetical protein